MARGRIVKVEGKRGVKYRYIAELGKHPATGDRWRETRTFDTQGEAQRALTKRLHEVDTGMLADPKKMTVKEYLDYWTETYCEINLAPSTIAGYKNIIENHLRPALGGLKIEKLAPSHIQAYYTKALKGGRKGAGKKDRPGLSPTFVLYHHRVLREALHHAVRWQIIARNPADACTPPRKENKEMKTFTREEIGLLLQELRGTYLYIPTYLAATTGMRQGEILALTWTDVDLEAGAITVQRNLNRFKKGEKPIFREPKTDRSRRRVHLFSEAVKELKRYQKMEYNKKKLASGKAWKDYNLVCCYDDGSPIPPATFSRAFRDHTRRLGLAGRFHDLRHSVATFLLEKGIHPKVVAEMLGNDVNIALKTYSHVTPTLGEQAAETLGDHLFGKI